MNGITAKIVDQILHEKGLDQDADSPQPGSDDRDPFDAAAGELWDAIQSRDRAAFVDALRVALQAADLGDSDQR